MEGLALGICIATLLIIIGKQLSCISELTGRKRYAKFVDDLCHNMSDEQKKVFDERVLIRSVNYKEGK